MQVGALVAALPEDDVHPIPTLRGGMREHRIQVDALMLIAERVHGLQPRLEQHPAASVHHILDDDDPYW